MAERKFAHLHLHTHYSLLDGANKIPDLVKQTKKLGMDCVAITDHGNLYGAIEFYRTCKDHQINPVIGYEAYLAPGDRREKKATRQGEAYSHLTLLAKNNIGFKNLIKLSSIAFLEGFYYNPRIDKEILEAHSEGLICLSGCLAGEFNQHIVNQRPAEATKLAKYFHKLFKDDFYIEIQNNGIDLQDLCTPVAVEISEKLGIPLVATADAHYLCSDDAEAHDVLFCINTGRKRDPRKKQYPEGRLPNPYYVRSPDDMYDLFPGFEDAVARSHEIAKNVDISLDFKKRYFPIFKQPEPHTQEGYLRLLCEQGVKERYGDNPPQIVWDRLTHELSIINRMGFAGYFLIVWDFVRFAREQGIPCSARGSGCGAVVCFVLYLSHVDPIEYDLLFERFLDPNRSEAPDIDIDFCQDRREKVIHYVKQKYGTDSVAQIGTFGTLAAKAALKDVGRVLDIPLDRVNMMCKFVPMKGAITLSLQDALDKSPDFRQEYDRDPAVKEWVDIARKLEGMNRGVGTHAAGVVIANGPITDYVPVQRATRKGDDGEKAPGDVVVTTQWEMGDIEKVGLLKMDFLGLRTLTLVDNALKIIKETRGIDIDIFKIPIDDKPTYELLQRGDAKGVFQFESQGIRDLLKRMKPDNIRDIIACTALYRPGPLEGGMVDEYIECKHGRKKPYYPHPIMEEVLNETYGVMVYQEQVMRMLNKMGGIELSSAYACIKAISKKIQATIDARKADFINGSTSRGMAAEKAAEIFEQIVKFGGYGFNKSHSAAYAYVTYQTAYLKHYYPAEFMAALLSSEIDDGGKRDMLVDHIADARKMNVPVLPPDVNKGQPDFTVVNQRIVFGLTAIKGLGRGAAEEIVHAREKHGKFRDLFDFCEKVDNRVVTKAAMEKLIKAGAMDCFGANKRAACFMVLPRALQAAETKADDRKRGQTNMFDLVSEDDPEHPSSLPRGFGESVPDAPEWPEIEKLKYEKEALDFFISSHPLVQYDDQLRVLRTHTTSEILKLTQKTDVRIAGMVTNFDTRVTKAGKRAGSRFAIFRLEDFEGQAKLVMWSETYNLYKDLVENDKILIFEGHSEMREGATEPDVIVNKVMTIDEARQQLTKGMVIRVPYSAEEEMLRKLDGVASILRRNRGKCPVYLSIRDHTNKSVQFKLGQDFWVNVAKFQPDELEMLLGQGCVIFTGR
ncbi:MAG: DNA polymerase III subunit alpha [Fimbriiglobus sp.]